MHSLNRTMRWLFVAVCLLLVGATTFAQSFKATVVGEVNDAAGASVAGATITITHEGTGREQRVVADHDGVYSIPQLAPGKYRITVEAQGFKRGIRTDVMLETDQTAHHNFILEAGALTDSVTVVSEGSAINTDTPSKGEVIVQKQLADLPLNGRDFNALALLVPGVYQRPDEDSVGAGLSVAGTRSDATNYSLDGVINRSDKNAGVGITTSVDSIREFKVSTSSYAAEFGRTAGAQVSVVTKSGENQFHGTLFEFVRNDMFDALNPLTGTKSLKRNQFGGVLGGPLALPRFGEGGPAIRSGKDRTFFFASYEQSIQRRSESHLDSAPNAAWLTGDFRNVLPTIRVTDPLNGRDFATPNVIPTNRFSPVAARMLQFIPAANGTGSLTDYLVSKKRRSNRQTFLGKVDHRFAANNNAYVRYAGARSLSFNPFSGDQVWGPFGRNTDDEHDTLAASDTHVFSPRVVNEVRFGYYHQRQLTYGIFGGTNIHNDYGIGGFEALGTSVLAGFPRISIDGFQDFGDRGNDPGTLYLKNYQILDLVSVTAGKHNLKFGGDLIRSSYADREVSGIKGRFRFRGAVSAPDGRARATGARSFADFLFGYPETVTRLQPDSSLLNESRGWQAAWFAQDDWRATSRLTLNFGLRYEYQSALDEKNNRLATFIPELSSIVTAGDTRFAPTLIKPDKNNFGPRIGFALRPFNNDKTVIRGGGGLYFSLEAFDIIRDMVGKNFPFIVTEDFTISRGTRPPQISFAAPFPAARGSVTGLNTPRGINPNFRTSEVYQYNLTVERELARDLVLEVGYVGSQGRHLGLRYNINQILPASLGGNGTLRPYANCGKTPAGAAVTCGDIAYQDQVASSNYNGLQVSVRRRAAQGLTLLASYTFARAFDLSSSSNVSNDTPSQEFPQNSYNLNADYGLADYNRTHQFSTSFNYDLPFLRKHKLLGGWQLNGIVSLQTGRPYTPQYSSGDFAIRRPNLIGNPLANIPAGLAFNPAAFADPGTNYGSAGRNILTGPNFRNPDLSLNKVFQLTEKARLQFRAESFNALNHPNFLIPGFFLDSSTVGRYTATANEGREFQFALKLLF